MNKLKKFLPCVITVVVVGALAFYGGMKYGQNQNSSSQNSGNRQGFQQSANGARRSINNGGFTTGQIISKDSNSITLQLTNGGSRVVFFSDSTKISKSSTSTVNDLQTGEQALVSGTPNSDGSITAQSIQLGFGFPQRQGSQQPGQ